VAPGAQISKVPNDFGYRLKTSGYNKSSKALDSARALEALILHEALL